MTTGKSRCCCLDVEKYKRSEEFVNANNWINSSFA